MIPWSAPGIQPSCTSFTVATITGTEAARPVANASAPEIAGRASVRGMPAIAALNRTRTPTGALAGSVTSAVVVRSGTIGRVAPVERDQGGLGRPSANARADPP